MDGKEFQGVLPWASRASTPNVHAAHQDINVLARPNLGARAMCRLSTWAFNLRVWGRGGGVFGEPRVHSPSAPQEHVCKEIHVCTSNLVWRNRDQTGWTRGIAVEPCVEAFEAEEFLVATARCNSIAHDLLANGAAEVLRWRIHEPIDQVADHPLSLVGPRQDLTFACYTKGIRGRPGGARVVLSWVVHLADDE